MRYYRAVYLADELGIEDPLGVKPQAKLKAMIAEKLGLADDVEDCG